MAKKKKTIIKESKKTIKKKTTIPKKDGEIDFSFLAIWSKKLKVPSDELKEKIEEIAVGLREKHGERWNETKVYLTARTRLYSELKADFKSSAIPWSTLILHKGNPNDYGARHYKKNMDAWAKNPKRAKEGNAKRGPLVKVARDKRGQQIAVPIEEREIANDGKSARKSFGKELPDHAWIMNAGGICVPKAAVRAEEWEKMLPFAMTISNQYADPTHRSFLGNVEVGRWYDIKATNATAKDNKESYKLNATSVTRWKPNNDLELSTKQIKELLVDFYCGLDELQEYHDSFMQLNEAGNKEQSFRLVVTAGEVVDITPSPDGKQSHRLTLDDESVGFGDEDDEEIKPSTMCWIDPDFKITFGKYSRIMVFGKTSAVFAKDLATNEVLDYFNPPTISVEGIMVLNLVEPEEVEDESGGDSDENYSPDAEAEAPKELEGLEDDKAENKEGAEEPW